MDTKMYQYISNAIKRLAWSPTHCTSERFVHILCIWWAQGTWVISAPYELILCDACDVVVQECVCDVLQECVWCCAIGVCDVVATGVWVMLGYRSVSDVECEWFSSSSLVGSVCDTEQLFFSTEVFIQDCSSLSPPTALLAVLLTDQSLPPQHLQ